MPASADTRFFDLSSLPPPQAPTVIVDISSRTTGRTPRRRGCAPILGSLCETGSAAARHPYGVLAGQRAVWLRFPGSYQTEVGFGKAGFRMRLDDMTFVITGAARGI